MTAVHSEFTTVTVYSDPAKHNTARSASATKPAMPAKTGKTQTQSKTQADGAKSPWQQLMTNVTDATKRRRNRLNARAELIALGVDPDRFLDYHRVQVERPTPES